MNHMIFNFSHLAYTYNYIIFYYLYKLYSVGKSDTSYREKFL